MDRSLRRELKSVFGNNNYWFNTSNFKNAVEIKIRSGNDVIEFLVPKEMVSASSVRLFVLWTTLPSLLLIIIALIFLKNQTKPLVKLAKAAERFGKGDYVNDFRASGSQEIRKAAFEFDRMAKRINRHLNQRAEMLSGISHDLRTPLTRLKLQLAMLKQKEVSDNMSKDIDEMEKMLNDYLQFAKTQTQESTTMVNINNLLSASKKFKHKNIFMNSASPGVISLFLSNSYYSSRNEYLDAISNAMKDEYEEIVNSGIKLQIDCPDLALSRHMTFKRESDEDFIKIAYQNMEILNHSLHNISPEMLRLHVCWGNYEGPHIHDIPIEKIFDVLMSFKGNYLLFESSNPRHQHEWEIFDKLKNKIPENKVLIPGVLDTTSNFVEHSSLVKQRIEKFVNIVGKERVIAGTDCGFGTFAGFGNVDPDIAYLKLQSLVDGASKVN